MSIRLRPALAVLMTLLLTALLAFNASAQDLDASVAQLDIEEIDGAEAAISRSYAMDIDIFVEAATSNTPQPVVPTGPMLMLALVMEFDSADHAADAAGMVHDRLIKQMGVDSTGIEMESSEEENLGDAAWALTGTRDAGPKPVTVNGLIVQDSVWVYLAIAISENDTSSDAALAVIRFALEHHADTNDIIYDHTGRSRGGIWEKLPSEGDTVYLKQGEQKVDALTGTQPIFDSQLLPLPKE